jgi:hypothetical protein
MRRLILAGFMAALFGAAATAQAGREQGSVGSPSSAPMHESMAEIGLQAANRIYTLPPEVDVDVTGSIDPRRCVGETVGQRMCQDTVDAAR